LKLSTYLILVQRLRIRGIILPLPIEYLLGEELGRDKAKIYWVAEDLGHSYLALKEHTADDKHLVYLILISVTALLTRIGTTESRMVQRLQVSTVLAASYT
jgi:hypothetical protein